VKYKLTVTFDLVNQAGHGVEADVDELGEELETRLSLGVILRLAPIGADRDISMTIANAEGSVEKVL
jgi:hypothetical protein